MDRVNNIGNIARCSICTIGMAANLLILYIVARYPSMRTACNVYVANLAAADFSFCLLALIQSIQVIVDSIVADPSAEMFSSRQQAELDYRMPSLIFRQSCDVSRVIAIFLVSASILLLTVIAVERHKAITDPLRSRQHGTVKHAGKTCAVVWMVSALAAAIDTIARNIVTNDWTFTSASLHTRASCIILKVESSDASDPFFIMELLCFLFLYVLPICIMIPLYVQILVKVRQSRRLTGRETRSGDQAFLMVFVVTVFFFVTWLPFRIVSFLIHQLASMENHVPVDVSLAIALFNSVANPFLYALLGRNFSDKVKKMFCCKQDTRLTIQAIQATGNDIGQARATGGTGQAQAQGATEQTQTTGETEQAQATGGTGQAQATGGTGQIQATYVTGQVQDTCETGKAQLTCGTWL
ncbi:AGTR1 [Branchiostoma lanceolatum]|uniref:AGTR1 protein n=1 Tax=Branchiostoma lanceolatum TaxID=7740 RepID=A0A8K0EGK8_BRALA|nr:AGTR1 [Branchiostoma lanceolatum]